MKSKGLYSILAVVTLVAVLVFSCDQVDLPPVENDGPIVVDDSCGTSLDSSMTFTKKVLVEDFTGHACGNCPRAHEKGEELKAIFGDDMVIVALHSGFFADASGSIHGVDYTADYNSAFSSAIDEEYDADNAGFPKGLIDRRENNGNALQNYPDWGGEVADRLSEEPIMGIRITSELTNNDTEADISVEVEYKLAGSENDYLVVIITEDSIESHQKDYSLTIQDIPNYQHRHVARAAVTSSVWGDRLCTLPIAAGDQFVKSYNMTLDPSWDADHCYVVAFVMDGNTKEVWNVNEVHLD